MNNITVPFNPIFKPVHQCKKRYVVMKGSAGSGKSVDISRDERTEPIELGER